MIYALRHPAVLLGLVIGFTAGCLLRALFTSRVLRGRSRLALAGSTRPSRLVRTPSAWLDPFGVVAAVVSGVGWGPRQAAAGRGQRRLWWAAIAAVVAHGVIAVIGAAGYVLAGGHLGDLTFNSTVSVLHGSALPSEPVVRRICIGILVESIGCAVLSVVPIPPLETGVAAWSTVPKSVGARRWAYRVLEEQWGVAVLLVLLLLPLAGQQPPLLALIGAIGDPILAAL